jgi:UDP-N-acetylglucosamine 1-carboxyvinyltransferase
MMLQTGAAGGITVAMARQRTEGLIEDDHAYVIRGGNPIQGTVTPGGNKNAALPMLAAALLAEAPVRIRNLPQIRDVEVMTQLLADLGAGVTESPQGDLEVTANTIERFHADPDLAGQVRASFLLAGPLLARWGRAELPRPGGDRIGRRPLDTHIHAFLDFGGQVDVEPDRYVLTAPDGLAGADVFLHEMSVMGTENAVMAAARARGTSTIRNAASEPHVQELCRMVEAMGCEIEGIGTNTLRVQGTDALDGVDVEIGPDLVEVGSFIGLAAVTGGELRITGARPDQHHRMTRIAYDRLGIRWHTDGDDIVVPADQELVIRDDLQGGIPKIDDGPWPAFPPDLTSIAVVLATQTKGTILIHEKMFESRLFWVDRLIAMGARIVLCDPHRVVVVGPSQLHGQVLASPDIRAGMALVIAALCAEGSSVIHNIHQVERGYESLHERLCALGADVERVER